MEELKRSEKLAISSLIIVPLLWFVIFVVKPFNFWGKMSIAILFLASIAVVANRKLLSLSLEKVTLRNILIGIGSAIILYFIFYVGNIVSGYLFPFKDAQITSVYSNRS